MKKVTGKKVAAKEKRKKAQELKILSLKFIKYCTNNNLEGVNDCLARGVDVNTKTREDEQVDSSLRTGLMFACQHGNAAIVSRLVKVPGLDINYHDEYYQDDTAAHLASLEGHTECVRILAETEKVDWNISNMENMTPLYWALLEGHSEIVNIIVQQPKIDHNIKVGFEEETLGHATVRGGNEKCVETLAAQESFKFWNVPNRWGDTPVMMALKEGKTEILKVLLKCPRVNLSCRDKEGWTLIFRAIQMDKHGKKFLKYLIISDNLYL